MLSEHSPCFTDVGLVTQAEPAFFVHHATSTERFLFERERKGHFIISNSSIIQSIGNPEMLPYCDTGFFRLSTRHPAVVMRFLLLDTLTAGLMVVTCCNVGISSSISEQEVLKFTLFHMSNYTNEQ